MRGQLRAQEREIRMLRRAGMSTASAELLLSRMRAKVDDLCREREALRKARGLQRTYSTLSSLVRFNGAGPHHRPCYHERGECRGQRPSPFAHRGNRHSGNDAS